MILAKFLLKISSIIKHNDGDNDDFFNEVNHFPAHLKFRLIKQFSMLSRSEFSYKMIPLSKVCIIKIHNLRKHKFAAVITAREIQTMR